MSGLLYHLSLTSALFRLVLTGLVQVWTEVCKLSQSQLCNWNTVVSAFFFFFFYCPYHQYRDIGFMSTFVGRDVKLCG